MFKVKNLFKIYNKKIIIDDFSYDFENGLYIITGKNGIGKSTLLKMLAGVIRPSNKYYRIENKKIAYLCEKIELSNGLVYPFLKSVANLNNIKTDIHKLMNKWKIDNIEMNKLSKGNKQKVGILMTYLEEADIYLYDEPTDSLDKETIQLFKELLDYLIKNNKTVILVSHELKYYKNMEYKEIRLDQFNKN